MSRSNPLFSMSLHFITGNSGKFKEVQALIPAVEQIDLALEEIQELDSHKVIAHKLAQALQQQAGPLMVEDTSLVIDNWQGLPGPFIKWFLQALGPEGIWQLAQAAQATDATAKTSIGYANADGQITFFDGEVKGQLVAPRGNRGFGWDSLFQPVGSTKTFAEMTLEEKNQFSMRQQAVRKLAAFLQSASE